MKKLLTMAALAVGISTAAVTASSAATIQFASFDQFAAGNTFHFTNNGVLDTGTVSGSGSMKFKFSSDAPLPDGPFPLFPVGDYFAADYLFTGTATQDVTYVGGNAWQQIDSGYLKFSTTAVGSQPAISNLLTIHFTNAMIEGSGSSWSFKGSDTGGVPGQTVTFSSSVFDFTTINQDDDNFSVSLVSSFTGTVNANGKLNSFDAGAAGLASLGTAVPEPATWGLMILGFAGVGGALRSRRREAGNVSFA